MSIHFTVWETEAPPAFPNARKEGRKASHQPLVSAYHKLGDFPLLGRAEAISKSSLTCFQQHFWARFSTPAARVWSYWSWSSGYPGPLKHKHLRTGTGWCSLGARTGGGDWVCLDEQGVQTRREYPSLIPSLASASLLHPIRLNSSYHGQPGTAHPPKWLLLAGKRSVLVVYRLLPAVMRLPCSTSSRDVAGWFPSSPPGRLWSSPAC